MMHGKKLTGYSIRKEINVFQKSVARKNNIVTRFEQSTYNTQKQERMETKDLVTNKQITVLAQQKRAGSSLPSPLLSSEN
jgi:transposase